MLRTTDEVKPTDSSQEDKPSLRALFDREESHLLRYAFSLTGRRAVAEEIVQEVFLQLHANWAEVEYPKAWLMRSVRNRALNHLRKSKREVCLSEGATDGEGASLDAPESLAARMEAIAALRQLVNDLPNKDRRLVELRYFEGCSYRQISESVGLTISNVGFRLHRVLKRLANELHSRGIDEAS